jgi:hypothetical protein
MAAVLPFNYMPTTNAAGTFNSTSSGGVQGMFIDAPATRFELRGGVLATTETLPMWGGVGINVTTTPNTGTNPPDGTQGGIITRATNVTANTAGSIVGFSVFNQAYGMATTPQSPVPMAGSGMQVNYLLLGSNAQIYVAVAPAITSGSTINAQYSWDFVNQQLIPYVAAYAAVTAGGVASGTYTSATGIISLTFSTAPLGAGVGSTANGVYLSVAGTTSSVSANSAAMNGDFPITSTGTSGTVINLQGPVGLGANTLTTTNTTLAAGGGALAVDVMDILTSNSMTVNYVSPNATWNYSGSVAIIKL